jgi:hypothetical protein
MAITVTMLVLLVMGHWELTADGPQAIRQTLMVVGGPAGTTFVVLIAFRLWDRWYPPGERVEPVTVESVQAAAVKADDTLQRVRAQNRRVSQMAAAVESQLQAAWLETNFSLCATCTVSRSAAQTARTGAIGQRGTRCMPCPACWSGFAPP